MIVPAHRGPDGGSRAVRTLTKLEKRHPPLLQEKRKCHIYLDTVTQVGKAEKEKASADKPTRRHDCVILPSPLRTREKRTPEKFPKCTCDDGKGWKLPPREAKTTAGWRRSFPVRQRACRCGKVRAFQRNAAEARSSTGTPNTTTGETPRPYGQKYEEAGSRRISFLRIRRDSAGFGRYFETGPADQPAPELLVQAS